MLGFNNCINKNSSNSRSQIQNTIWELNKDDLNEKDEYNSDTKLPYIDQWTSDSDSSKNNDVNKMLNFTRSRRQKYMPIKKTAGELFAKTYQIAEGPAFDKIFGSGNDCEISVTGGDGKNPIVNSFKECNFCPQIMKNISLKNYRKPTQIQKCIMPLILFKNFDIMGQAQTGSGKTAAFLLPIIHIIQLTKTKKKNYINKNSPYAIVVSPTKELAQQLANDARTFAEQTDVKVVASYGDLPFRENINEIQRGCDILILTWTRLKHFVRDQLISLTDLMFLILDEADQLLESQINLDVETIKNYKKINKTYRTLMFSATFNIQIQNFAQELLNSNYCFVCVGERNCAAETVKKYDKQDLLINLLHTVSKKQQRVDKTIYYEVEKTIVFVQKRRQSDRLAIALAFENFLVISINAERSLQQRLNAVDCFTKGDYNILVATDVAARGLNFPKVKHVINYDLPAINFTSYVHRIGRAGRVGNLGRATSFFDPTGEEVQFISDYIMILKNNNQEIPKFMQKLYIRWQKEEKEFYRLYNRDSSTDQENEK